MGTSEVGMRAPSCPRQPLLQNLSDLSLFSVPERHSYFNLETETQRKITFEPLSGARPTSTKAGIQVRVRPQQSCGKRWNPSFVPSSLSPDTAHSRGHALGCLSAAFPSVRTNIFKLSNYLPTCEIGKRYSRVLWNGSLTHSRGSPLRWLPNYLISGPSHSFF